MNNTTRRSNTTDTPQVNRTKGIVSIGDAARQLMDNRVTPQKAVFDAIINLWSRLLPAELVQHSRIAEISGGQIKVQVDSSSYIYELQLCSFGLLSEIQRQYPQARLKEIKFVLI